MLRLVPPNWIANVLLFRILQPVNTYASHPSTSDASRGLKREAKTPHALATRSAPLAGLASPGTLEIPTLQGLEADINPCAKLPVFY